MASLEIQIDGMAEAIEAVDDPLLGLRIGTARAVARRELARLRAKYNSTFPAGKRVVWGGHETLAPVQRAALRNHRRQYPDDGRVSRRAHRDRSPYNGHSRYDFRTRATCPDHGTQRDRPPTSPTRQGESIMNTDRLNIIVFGAVCVAATAIWLRVLVQIVQIVIGR